MYNSSIIESENKIFQFLNGQLTCHLIIKFYKHKIAHACAILEKGNNRFWKKDSKIEVVPDLELRNFVHPTFSEKPTSLAARELQRKFWLSPVNRQI